MSHLKLITSLVVVLLFRLSHKTSNKKIKDNLKQQGEDILSYTRPDIDTRLNINLSTNTDLHAIKLIISYGS